MLFRFDSERQAFMNGPTTSSCTTLSMLANTLSFGTVSWLLAVHFVSVWNTRKRSTKSLGMSEVGMADTAEEDGSAGREWGDGNVLC